MPVHAQALQAQPAGGQWHFDDEVEQTPGWGEVVRTQAVDLAIFAGFTVLALVSFFRKSTRLKYVTLAACVVLLGFWKSQLITIVNIFGLTQWNLPDFRHNMTWYLFAVFTVVTTILWGRIYCGRVCAFGYGVRGVFRSLKATEYGRVLLFRSFFSFSARW